MRDVVLLPILGALVLAALPHPWIGMMTWTWVSIMSPHRLAWVASTLPVAAIVGGATLIGTVITRDRRTFYVTPSSAALMLFMIWICVTYQFAIYPEKNFIMWSKVMKIDCMILLAMVLFYSRKHIITLVWVLVGSLGFYGVKGGIFTIATGGSSRVWGPPGSFIEGNNELGLALIMTIPLMRFLQTQVTRRWQKHALTAAMLLTATAAIGTQSRGAFLAISASSIFLIARSKNRIVLGVMAMLVAVALATFMPESWHHRMGTIETYQSDHSAMGRVNAWGMAYNLAKHHFFGSGFENVTKELFDKYAPYHDIGRQGPHSIYFQVLGQHGFVGLFLFLMIWVFVWRAANQVIRNARRHPQAAWCANLAAMCQTSLVGYFVGGAFLGLAYYDLPYNLLVIVVLCSRWIRNKEWARESPKSAQPLESDLSRQHA